MRKASLTIFLDFDGVLTPRAMQGNELGVAAFSCLPVFEDAVRPMLSYLEIVISSDWRHRLSFVDLCSLFSADVAEAVIDTTGPERWRRELEIIDWLNDNPRDTWLAVDDLVDHFEAHANRLIAIDHVRGFQAEDGNRLRMLSECLLTRRSASVIDRA